MQIASSFKMAIHMFACIDTLKDMKMTRAILWLIVFGTNHINIGKLLGLLNIAGLVEIARGTSGKLLLDF